MPKNKKAKRPPKHASRATASTDSQQLDSVFLLKLVLYLVLGSQWVRFIGDTTGLLQFSLPFGFIIGLLFAAHDHFRIDRRIEYAVLLCSMFVSFWLQAGLVVRL